MQKQNQISGVKDLDMGGNDRGKVPRKERKRCVAWTEEEHRNFLIGMEVLGVGNWKGVSQVYVPTRTAPQIASHAQKYFHRVGDKGKKRARPSLFDLDLNELDNIVVAKKAAIDARARDGDDADLKAPIALRADKDRGRQADPAAAAAAAAAKDNHGANPAGQYESLMFELTSQARIRELQAQLDRLQQQADRLTKDAAPSAAAAAAPGPSPDLLGLIAHASQVQLQVEEHRREIEKAFGAAGTGAKSQALEAACPFPPAHSTDNSQASGAAGPVYKSSPSAASPPAAASPRPADKEGADNRGLPLGSSATDEAARGATLSDRLAAHYQAQMQAPSAAVPKAPLAVMTSNLSNLAQSGPVDPSGHGVARSSLLGSSFGLVPVPSTPHAIPAPLLSLSASPPNQPQQGPHMQALPQLEAAGARAAGDARRMAKIDTQAPRAIPGAPSGPGPLLTAAFPSAAAPMSMNLLGFNSMAGFDLGSGGLSFGPGNTMGVFNVNMGAAQPSFAPAGPSHGNPCFGLAGTMGYHPQFPQGGIFVPMPQAAPRNQPQGMVFAQRGPGGQAFP